MAGTMDATGIALQEASDPGCREKLHFKGLAGGALAVSCFKWQIPAQDIRLARSLSQSSGLIREADPNWRASLR